MVLLTSNIFHREDVFLTAFVSYIYHSLDENVVNEELMVYLVELVAFVMKQEKVALGFQPQKIHEENSQHRG